MIRHWCSCLGAVRRAVAVLLLLVVPACLPATPEDIVGWVRKASGAPEDPTPAAPAASGEPLLITVDSIAAYEERQQLERQQQDGGELWLRLMRRAMDAWQEGRQETALELTRQGHAVALAAHGADSDAVRTALRNQGLLLLNMGRAAEAKAMYINLLENQQRAGVDPEIIARSHMELSEVEKALAASPESLPQTPSKPSAAQAAAVKPPAVKPPAVKSTAVKPAAVKPTAVQPTAVQPTAVQPSAVKPTAAKDVAAKPAMSQTTAPSPAGSPGMVPGSVAPESPATPELQEARALARAGVVLFDAGRFTEARDKLASALLQAQRAGQNETPAWLGIRHLAAMARFRAGDAAGAEREFAAVTAARAKVLGAQHGDTLSSGISHAAVLFTLGREREAEPLLARAQDALRKTLGAEHPRTLAATLDLAAVNGKLDQGEKAEGYWRFVISHDRASGPLFGRRARRELAVWLTGRKRFADAMALLEQLTNKSVAGEDPAVRLADWVAQGMVALALQRPDAALQAHREALGLWREDGGKDPTLGEGILSRMARLLESGEQTPQRLDILNQLVDLRQKLRGPRDPATLEARHHRAKAVFDVGRREEALEEMRAVYTLRQEVLGAEHGETLASLGNLAAVLFALQRHEEALPLLRDSWQRRVTVLGVDHSETLLARFNLGVALGALGKIDAAREHLEAVLAARTRLLGADHPQTTQAAAELSRLSRNQGTGM
ncbi:MAG: tetratricopeptide repeat protein [Magnetococcus sp. WYHC-3]